MPFNKPAVEVGLLRVIYTYFFSFIGFCNVIFRADWHIKLRVSVATTLGDYWDIDENTRKRCCEVNGSLRDSQTATSSADENVTFSNLCMQSGEQPSTLFPLNLVFCMEVFRAIFIMILTRIVFACTWSKKCYAMGKKTIGSDDVQGLN